MVFVIPKTVSVGSVMIYVLKHFLGRPFNSEVPDWGVGEARLWRRPLAVS
jgi:hypothetical protein